MDTAKEQRAHIKFCVKNGKTGAGTLQMLRTAFSDDCLSQAVVYQWVTQFKEGQEPLKDIQADLQTPAMNKQLLKCMKKFVLIAVSPSGRLLSR
jgi:hypothetical protein